MRCRTAHGREPGRGQVSPPTAAGLPGPSCWRSAAPTCWLCLPPLRFPARPPTLLQINLPSPRHATGLLGAQAERSRRLACQDQSAGETWYHHAAHTSLPAWSWPVAVSRELAAHGPRGCTVPCTGSLWPRSWHCLWSGKSWSRRLGPLGAVKSCCAHGSDVLGTRPLALAGDGRALCSHCFGPGGSCPGSHSWQHGSSCMKPVLHSGHLNSSSPWWVFQSSYSRGFVQALGRQEGSHLPRALCRSPLCYVGVRTASPRRGFLVGCRHRPLPEGFAAISPHMGGSPSVERSSLVPASPAIKWFLRKASANRLLRRGARRLLLPSG